MRNATGNRLRKIIENHGLYAIEKIQQAIDKQGEEDGEIDISSQLEQYIKSNAGQQIGLSLPKAVQNEVRNESGEVVEEFRPGFQREGKKLVKVDMMATEVRGEDQEEFNSAKDYANYYRNKKNNEIGGGFRVTEENEQIGALIAVAGKGENHYRYIRDSNMADNEKIEELIRKLEEEKELIHDGAPSSYGLKEREIKNLLKKIEEMEKRREETSSDDDLSIDPDY